MGANGDWDFWISDLVKNPDGTNVILTHVVNFDEVREVPVSQIHSPHVHVRAPGIFSVLLSSVQMLKTELGAESNGKLPDLLNHW